jgi:uncharacterized cupredoxin-like copper-binding protein
MRNPIQLTILTVGMLAAGACGAPAPSATPTPPDPVEVEITLGDNTLTSSLTTFQVGVPYVFVIKNNGMHAHDFNINQPREIIKSLSDMIDGALLRVPTEELPAGAEVTVEYVFPESATELTLELSCLILQHYIEGMRIAIQVTP